MAKQKEPEYHWHCEKCWSQEYSMHGLTMVCSRCGPDAKLLLCTPIICASS